MLMLSLRRVFFFSIERHDHVRERIKRKTLIFWGIQKKRLNSYIFFDISSSYSFTQLSKMCICNLVKLLSDVTSVNVSFSVCSESFDWNLLCSRFLKWISNNVIVRYSDAVKCRFIFIIVCVLFLLSIVKRSITKRKCLHNLNMKFSNCLLSALIG